MKKGAICIVGFPEEVIFSDDILWKVAHIVKGFLVVVIFSVIIVEEDGIIVSWVEGVKTPFDRAGDQGLGRRSQ